MIFDIVEGKNSTIFVEVVEGDAWDAILQMSSMRVYIGCYNGYENCLVFVHYPD